MAGFLYFLPGVSKPQVDPALLRERGLSTPLRDVLSRWMPPHNVALIECDKGPEGESGVVVYPLPVSSNLPRKSGYAADQQEWRRVGNCFIGIDTEKRPTPDELRRPTDNELREVIVPGKPCELGDGNVWHSPVIRGPSGSSGLPQSWDLDASGELVTKTVAEFEWAWELAGRVWDVVSGTTDADMPDIFKLCAELLSVNYRLGIVECGMLQLIGSHNWESILWPAVFGDLKELAEAGGEEKKSPDIESISNT